MHGYTHWAVNVWYATLCCNEQNKYSAYPQWDTGAL